MRTQIRGSLLASILQQFASILILAGAVWALTVSPRTTVFALPDTHEHRAARALEASRSNPQELRAFLQRMPKGADLHSHLSGAVYAESWIRAGAEDGLCVDRARLSFVKPKTTLETRSNEVACGQGDIPVSHAFRDQHLYDGLISSFSMRSFVPTPGVSAHDHFFDAFAKFSGTSVSHRGEWVDELARRAAAQNEQYLELMETPDFSHTAAIANAVGWRADLGALREELLARGLRSDIEVAREHFEKAEALRREREHCGRPDAAPACSVQVRYLYQILRDSPKEQVFAQAVLGFEVASADPRVVGINLVGAEDGYISMSDYAVHIHIVDVLHELYPRVHISLHAGEIAPGLVSYEGLCCHIRLAVEEGHAERIGHGVDVMYEDRAYELINEMLKKHVMVEINLTSNDVILGVSGKTHPFSIYRKFGVPVALSTDDEGVSRIELTHEYVLAVETYGLDYPDLKLMVRTGLEHAFLQGSSLWREDDNFTRPNAACVTDVLGAVKQSKSCAAFLASSEKARQQWELERRFAEFESGF